MSKVCTKCNQSKGLTSFGKRSRHLDGLEYICRSCKSEQSKQSYRKIKEKYVELTQEELEAKILYMGAAQAEWYREEGKDTTGSRDMFKEYAKSFWDQVESRNQQGAV